jgi:hypothetical protein
MFFNMMPEDSKNTCIRGNLRMASMSLSQKAIYFNGLGSLEGPRSAAGKRRKGTDNQGLENYFRRP